MWPTCLIIYALALTAPPLNDIPCFHPPQEQPFASLLNYSSFAVLLDTDPLLRNCPGSRGAGGAVDAALDATCEAPPSPPPRALQQLHEWADAIRRQCPPSLSPDPTSSPARGGITHNGIAHSSRSVSSSSISSSSRSRSTSSTSTSSGSSSSGGGSGVGRGALDNGGGLPGGCAALPPVRMVRRLAEVRGYFGFDPRRKQSAWGLFLVELDARLRQRHRDVRFSV